MRLRDSAAGRIQLCLLVATTTWAVVMLAVNVGGWALLLWLAASWLIAVGTGLCWNVETRRRHRKRHLRRVI